ncbi:pyruvate kinase [Raphidocelis subcapitata]|uniref:Pyruvate kinase n=1 Tax=Raphidocelis subcapitata TaxID=307507 RepID=A0A2V0PJE0_9CHLO|nr:pyruvate kinase [Raphidocelis subcapitata]|eukprot:GBF99836.1 pyruvate kinase [Raphidocelis subcapitata]
MGAPTAQREAPGAPGLAGAMNGGGAAPGPAGTAVAAAAAPDADGPAVAQPAAALAPGSSLATPSGAPSSRTSLGLAMMDSFVDEARLRHVSSRDELEAAFRRREVAVAALKAKMSKDWAPEYRPHSIVPPTSITGDRLRKTFMVSEPMILKDVPVARKTKIVCTLGPSCWSEEGLGALMDAGMNVARFNFSHGDHAGHKEVLDRVRAVAAAKGKHIGMALDTKGPEIRTAMLKGGKDILLEEGQEVKIVAVGAGYTSFEGYKNEATGETVIGLSYDKLCQYVKPGNLVLMSDGTVTITVTEVLNGTELKGRVMSTHKLGQRKNVNLPGVVSDLPVLGPKDVDDVQKFACKHDMDFIFASFVQCADDVRFIRKVLAEAGGSHIRVICKIESAAGVLNFDQILAETDGIMVARGDLAMEIPPEKVALAQKMMINKCQLAGKMIICATQMMESMIENPYPARAEMTDVANAVFDGTDAVMLSGETANGKHPALVVRTMLDIAAKSELGISYYEQFHSIRYNNAAREFVSAKEAILSGVSKAAISFCTDANGDGIIDLSEGCLAVVLTEDGSAARLVAKYRPPCPVVVVSPNARALRSLSATFGLYPLQVESFTADPSRAITAGIDFALSQGLAVDGIKVLVVSGGPKTASADASPVVTSENLGMRAMSFLQRDSVHTPYTSPFCRSTTYCNQDVHIGVETIVRPSPPRFRATKIVATIGPATRDAAAMASLIDAGVNVARFNVKHNTQEENRRLLRMWRTVVAEKARAEGILLGLNDVLSPESAMRGTWVSIRGHEVRSARLRSGEPVAVAAGEEVVVVGLGDEEYFGSWRGGRPEGGGPVTIGISYERVGEAVKEGDTVLIDDGNLRLEVLRIEGPTRIVGRALSGHTLSELALLHLPRAHKGGPRSLSPRDIEDLRLAVEFSADYVSVPFVRGAADLEQVRSVLDEAGAPWLKIIAQIDCADAIAAFDEILGACDGVMVSRINLGMDIPASKVPLAQKWLIQKANLVAKPAFVAGQVMEGMATNVRPSRPEITDTVNSVYDGADGLVLMQETSTGRFAGLCVRTMAKIITDAEAGLSSSANYGFVRNFTPKPMSLLEAQASNVAKTIIDCMGSVAVVMTDRTEPVRLVAKYKPGVPLLVITTKQRVATQCSLLHGAVPVVVLDITKRLGLCKCTSGHAEQVVLMSGPRDAPFLTSSTFHAAEVLALALGDGPVARPAPTGYRGDMTLAMRSTKVSLDLIASPIKTPRKTKIVCTLGPACWSEEGLGALMDAGMNVARFNFSHGDHAGHKEVLDRVRAVAAAKGKHIATMLDTKGPEIRTAMLRGHANIQIDKGQEVKIVAVGAGYTSFEGYKDEATGETVIGLSYDKLCQHVKPGGRILIADGSLSVEVRSILSDTELLGVALNAKSLGERKNANLPGVLVDLPVLGPKDVDDVQNFACKHGMDLISVSFVQSADDVRFVRKTLDEAGGQGIKIISKIESWHGVTNYDEILAASDGIMVARGDLAMEVPSEKVALAQKMMTTKANIAGKFVITATQMLESMTSNPLPTRAEMTDVANAVFDGTDAVMLSGETAGGKFPVEAVCTMAAIVANAEVGVNPHQAYSFIRAFTDRPMTGLEAAAGCAAKAVLDLDAGLVVLASRDAEYVKYVCKYRPRVPVLVITDDPAVARACAPIYAAVPYLADSLPTERCDLEAEVLLERGVIAAVQSGLCSAGHEVVVLQGVEACSCRCAPVVSIKVAPGRAEQYVSHKGSTWYEPTLSLRSTAIALEDILDPLPDAVRKTKIVCTLGPACWSEEGLGALMDAGMNVARFNFSHGDHAGHKEVLDRVRAVAAAKGKHIATMLDTKGPEIRTAMLKGGGPLELKADQEVVLEAVGPDYKTWEGGVDEATGVAHIGISYDKLCRSVKPGNIIKIADGTLSVRVEEILSDKELRGRCLNAKSLGETKNVNLPGVHVDMLVLTDKDLADLVNFAVRYGMDFVAASFVQSGDDVRYIRKVLDTSGGASIQIISKIENEAGLEHLDDVLRLTDGVMVARGDLAMGVPSEKVALAQKMLITKANIAGKFVITATQMLESMTSNPLPTRAEMTDVANAVFDGTDAVMLSGETANGAFPTRAVETMAAIVTNAETANSFYSTATFIHDHTPKPSSRLEAIGATVAAAVADCNAALVITFSVMGEAPRMVAKYKPAVPQLARSCAGVFGAYPFVVDSLRAEPRDMLRAAAVWARSAGLWTGAGSVLLLTGQYEASADMQPELGVVPAEEVAAEKLAVVRSIRRTHSITA